MVNPNLNINLFQFQEDAALKLLDFVNDPNSKQTITVKSPTGSGKTIILIDFIDEYFDNIDTNTAFIWLCPGNGDLEEQSRDKMRKIAPHRVTQNLFDALSSGFGRGTTTFINWELVTSKTNNALKPGEQQNLFDRVASAKREGVNFIIIIDEEHQNDTSKASSIIDAFAASHIIRVSATANKNPRFEYHEIDENEVINAGLITKAIYVNEGLTDNMEIGNDYEVLLDFADEKRKEIAARYTEIGKNIRPLVLIQLPNRNSDKNSEEFDTEQELLIDIQNKLAKMGYTTKNGMVNIWLNENKQLSDDLTKNDGTPVFLIMKQAISTGWDCPRAKILVKLRDIKSQIFEIQTIGRIRRMPEAVHYEDDLLDFCYLYTFDEKYKNELLSNLEHTAYETKRLFLKDKCKTFTLEKQTRDLDFNGLGERDVYNKIYNHLVEKYGLTKDRKNNQRILKENGYTFGSEIKGRALQGEFVHTEKLAESTSFISTRRQVDTNKNRLELLHSVDIIKSAIGMSNANVKSMLEKLFRKKTKSRSHCNKLLSLPTEEFYAFVINNDWLLRNDFREVTSKMIAQETLDKVSPRKSTFRIPEQEFYRYDTKVKDEVEFISNAYKEYTSGFVNTLARSTCEVLFENYCEKQDDIDWVYKNGDKGQQYFSIVYFDGIQKQWLFYPDYIVKKNDGTIWIIETKGGESHGQDKNIDIEVENKFNAFQKYANDHNICWGFVRDKDGLLYLNNTSNVWDMADEHWESIAKKF